jgi:hypothetical protein
MFSLAEWLRIAKRDMDWYNSLPSKYQKQIRDQARIAEDEETVLLQRQLIETEPEVVRARQEREETEFAETEKTRQAQAAEEQREQQQRRQSAEAIAASGLAGTEDPDVVEQRLEQGLPAIPLSQQRENLFLQSSAIQALVGLQFRQRPTTSVGSRPALIDGMQIGETQVSDIPTPFRDAQDFIMNLWEPGNRDEVIRLQRLLVKAGKLEDGEFIPGRPDAKFEQALSFAIIDSRKSKRALIPYLRDVAKGEKQRLAAEEAGAEKAKAKSFQEQAEDTYKQTLLSKYMELWGTAPPPGYIQRIASSGMNFYEFESHERSKPSFQTAPRFQMERISLEAQLADAFGGLG